MLSPSHTYLWNDGEFGPEVMETYLSHVHPVYDNLPRSRFYQAEQGQHHGRLTCSCSSHDAKLEKHEDIMKPDKFLSYGECIGWFVISDYEGCLELQLH